MAKDGTGKVWLGAVLICAIMSGEPAEAHAALHIPVQTTRELRLTNDGWAKSILIPRHCDIGSTNLPLSKFLHIGTLNHTELQFVSLARSENHWQTNGLLHEVKRITFISKFLLDHVLLNREIPRPSFSAIGNDQRNGIAVWIHRRIWLYERVQPYISPQLSFGSILGSFHQLPSDNPKTNGGKCEENFRAFIPPPVRRFAFLILGTIIGWFLVIRGGQYLDNQRSFFGAACVGSGIFMWAGVMLIWFISRYDWSWCLPI